MNPIEAKSVVKGIRLTLSAAAITSLAACGLIENNPDSFDCPQGKQEISASQAFPSFDKTLSATLECNNGVIDLVVVEIATGKKIVQTPTDFRRRTNSFKVYWSQDGSKLWVADAKNTSFFYAYDIPR